MKNDKESLKKLTSFNSNVSCHYYITESGNLINMVPDSYVAWHAGKSSWGKEKSLNNKSIGIEISNPGHEHGYKKFNDNQIKSLVKISKFLIKKYNINKKNILGHSDVSPQRKLDPGEKFPWKILYKKKIGIWHSINSIKLKVYRGKFLNLDSKKFFQNLKKIGYCVQYKNSEEFSKIIKIFQMRYRPEIVDGKLDLECFEIAKSLYNIK